LKLVAIAENGDRQFDLLAAGDRDVRDLTPAVSPDGKWLVFASTRERTTGTSLWIAKLGVEVVPRRLTTGDAFDARPTWTHDGAAIVFASTRDGGDYDLWQVKRDGGAPIALTSGEHHEVNPSIAPDGTIVYAAIDKETRASSLELRAPDGTITKLTPGPDERDPAVSPDGKLVAYTSKVARDDRADSELWILDRATKQARQVANLPPTDETDPVWSRDGRFLFATSVLPGSEQPLFASIVFVDRDEQPMRVRILRDSAGPLMRVQASIATALDARTLRGDPEYLPELANVIARAIANQQMQK
jgi:Tol biopolymer transport system component